MATATLATLATTVLATASVTASSSSSSILSSSSSSSPPSTLSTLNSVVPTDLNNYGSLLYQQAHWYTVGVFEKYGDPRVSNYHLMRTPWPTIAATIVYYWFVRRIGPRMMQHRKPYDILPLVRVYNFMMATWNAFGFYTGCQLVNYGLDTIGCRPVDPFQRDEKTLNQIYYGWMFLTSRLVEFADTIFFVLRKKDNQVSSFHVFHHSIVPTSTWFFMKFAPGGNSAIFPYINSFVHTIMYTYYFLATFPAAKPYLGWKRYLTQMQIVQFFIIIACCMQPLFIPGCQFPRALSIIMIGFSFIFIYLFVDFYLKAYKRAARLGEKQRQIEREEEERRKIMSPTATATSTTTTKQINGLIDHNDTNNNPSPTNTRAARKKEQ